MTRASTRPGPESSGDEGSAIVEFIAMTFVLLLPLIYLTTTLARIQAAAYATEGAARHGAMVVAQAPDPQTGDRRLQTLVSLALKDQGLPGPGDGPPQVQVSCSAGPCQTPNESVRVRVRITVALPGVPGVLRSVLPLAVPVQADGVATVDEFRQ